jgi:hypothetical protein
MSSICQVVQNSHLLLIGYSDSRVPLRPFASEVSSPLPHRFHVLKYGFTLKGPESRQGM